MEARVGIEFEDKNFLFKINKKASLRDNIESICKKNSLMSSQSYGLIFSYTPNGTNLNNYVTEDNFDQIQDGFTLKLVESLDSIIDRIFPNMVYERQQTFDDLYTLSTDPGFVKALVRKGRDKNVLQWLTDKYLAGKELSACLLTLLHLLKKQYVKELDPGIIKNIIKCVKNDSPPTPPAQLQYALAVLCQMLYLRGHDLNKQMIILELSINDLIPFIWSQEHTILQLNTMMLINAMVKSVKGEKRHQLIKELNRSKNKDYIFNNIIQNANVETSMAHELYIYQTYILSLHTELLNNFIDSNNSVVFKELLDISEDCVSRSSTFIDFEEVARSRCNSTTTVLGDLENIRISFASMESEKSVNSELLNSPQSPFDDRISYLTHDCLIHYRKYHYKNFCRSRIEANTYGPGIYISSEQITRVLAKILHIGMDPTKSGQSYYALVFNSNLKLPFFLELFSRTMWLLSKTRREMKAWTLDDYSKVLVVLEKQIQLVLEQQPMDYYALTKELMKITYEEVEKQWQEEKGVEWKLLYEKNPSVQVIKNQFRSANELLVLERRISTLQKGDVFPKLPEKKGKQGFFFLRLSDNRRTVVWRDWDETPTNFTSKEPERFNMSEIKYFVIGKACPHVKDHSVKHSDRAFSVILEEGDVINFVAKDAATANIWIDGFNLLLGKPHRSADYKKELEVLQEMDCALHLLELQNIPIPNSAPPIPPPPSTKRSKPVVPPKSPHLVLRKSLLPVYKSGEKDSCNKQNNSSKF